MKFSLHRERLLILRSWHILLSMSLRYTVILEGQPEGGYHVFCPALPGCHSEGENLEEALANIKEAIEVYVESLMAHGEEIPREDLLIKSMDIAV